MDLSSIPDALLKHFWRGMVDGDGSLFYRNHADGRSYRTLELCGSRQMVEKFRLWVEKEIGVVTQAARVHKSIYKVDYQQMEQAYQVSRLLYDGSNIYLDRKKRKAEEWWQFKAANGR